VPDETKLASPPETPEIQVAQSSGAGQAKVELDLEDAPFLQEIKTPDPPAASDGEKDAAAPDATAPPPVKKKKRLILAGAALLALIGIGAAAWWFVLRTPPHPPEVVKPELIVVPTKPAVTPKQYYIKEFAPFFIHFSDEKKISRFLICKFSTLSNSPNSERELDRKMISLRDAVYYYLRGKNIDYLLSAQNSLSIKADLVTVLNGYLTQAQIEDVLFESYLNE
jgi:flagellar FliL protein